MVNVCPVDIVPDTLLTEGVVAHADDAIKTNKTEIKYLFFCTDAPNGSSVVIV